MRTTKVFLLLALQLLCVRLARAESLFLEVVGPGSATVGPPATFSVTINLRDADKGNQIVVPGRIVGGAPTVTLTALLGGGPASGNGVLNVTSVVLSSPSITFTESYTAAETISIRASVTLSTVTPTGTSNSFALSPSAYTKVLMLLPGETASTGNLSATGKTGSPTYQLINTAFPVTVRAVDQYWNTVTGAVGTARLTPSVASTLSGTLTQAFTNGVSNFSVTVTTYNLSYGIQADDQASGAITAQSGTLAVYGSYYFDITVPPTVTAASTFSVTVQLRDSLTGGLVLDTAIPNPRPTVTLTIRESGSAGPGTEGVGSFTLNTNTYTFEQTYTRAFVGVRQRATATIGPLSLSNDSSAFTVVPSSYSRVLLLMPWETAGTTGVPSATGKSGVLSTSYIVRDAPLSVNMRAVDQNWNIVTSAVGTARLDTVTPSGFVGGTNTQAWSGGLASFTGVSFATCGYNLTMRGDDSVNPGVLSQSASATVFPPGTAYSISLATAVTMLPTTFPMFVQLKDGNNQVVGFATHTFNLDIYQSSPTTGVSLGTVGGTLAVGRSTVATQSISRTGTFEIEATDAFGFDGRSAVTEAHPESHYYRVILPTYTVFGMPFSVSVERRQVWDDALVDRDRDLTFIAYYEDTSPLSSAASIDLTNTLMTTSPQGYNQVFREPTELLTSRRIFFRLESSLDGDGESFLARLATNSVTMDVVTGLPGSLTISTVTALVVAGGSAQLRATLRDTPEGHRIPNRTVYFSLAQGTGTVVSTQVVTGSTGLADTVLQTVIPMSPLYEMRALHGSLIASTTLQLVVPPSTTITTNGLATVASDGVTLIKTNTQIILTGTTFGAIASINYRTNSGSWNTYTGPFTLPTGLQVLDAYSTDILGQVGPVTSRVFRVSAAEATEGRMINYPNPFRAGREQTVFEYTLDRASDVTLEVFNATGELVYRKTLRQGESGTSVGVNRILWDGRNGNSDVIGNGLYIARLKSSTAEFKRKVVVVK